MSLITDNFWNLFNLNSFLPRACLWFFLKTGQTNWQTHVCTRAENTQTTSPFMCRRWCGEEDVTIIWEMLQILISTHVLYHIYLITIIIILIISNNYPLKLNKTSMQLRGSNTYRIVQQLATIKLLCVWMREKRKVWRKKSWDEEEVPWIYCLGAGLKDPPPQVCQQPVPARQKKSYFNGSSWKCDWRDMNEPWNPPLGLQSAHRSLACSDLLPPG